MLQPNSLLRTGLSIGIMIRCTWGTFVTCDVVTLYYVLVTLLDAQMSNCIKVI